GSGARRPAASRRWRRDRGTRSGGTVTDGSPCGADDGPRGAGRRVGACGAPPARLRATTPDLYSVTVRFSYGVLSTIVVRVETLASDRVGARRASMARGVSPPLLHMEQ